MIWSKKKKKKFLLTQVSSKTLSMLTLWKQDVDLPDVRDFNEKFHSNFGVGPECVLL